ncbi:helix-turn-helix domain-containing protein [Microvirga brassicacearum]|uniref:Helix-turn-helix domain-containing protein n=1 Tax=Microvirga brassicacearum TaxID=2580413 RepID=A0A5N3P619_9HYPH|nr:helix-turn-helix domain-containing protein [Microvirga brassicacearum]
MRSSGLSLEEEEKKWLAALTKSAAAPRRVNRRAGIILKSAAGLTDNAIATEFQVSLQTVGKWRRRYREAGLSGLEDGARSGKPRRIQREEVAALISRTIAAAPPEGGRWTVRKIARVIGLPPATTGRIWRDMQALPESAASVEAAPFSATLNVAHDNRTHLRSQRDERPPLHFA